MPATAMTDELQQIDAEIRELKKRQAALLKEAAAMDVADVTLHRGDGSPVRLSELFGERSEMILVHNMGRSCPYCTLWADGLNGLCEHLGDRCAFVLGSPDEPAVMREFSEGRGWRFTCASTAGTTLTADLGFEPEPGKYWPGASMLHRRADGSIVRTGMVFFGPGDDFCALWPMFDQLEGGAEGWAPKFSYAR